MDEGEPRAYARLKEDVLRRLDGNIAKISAGIAAVAAGEYQGINVVPDTWPKLLKTLTDARLLLQAAEGCGSPIPRKNRINE